MPPGRARTITAPLAPPTSCRPGPAGRQVAVASPAVRTGSGDAVASPAVPTAVPTMAATAVRMARGPTAPGAPLRPSSLLRLAHYRHSSSPFDRSVSLGGLRRAATATSRDAPSLPHLRRCSAYPVPPDRSRRSSCCLVEGQIACPFEADRGNVFRSVGRCASAPWGHVFVPRRHFGAEKTSPPPRRGRPGPLSPAPVSCPAGPVFSARFWFLGALLRPGGHAFVPRPHFGAEKDPRSLGR